MSRAWWLGCWLALAWLAPAGSPAAAAALRYCDQAPTLSAAEQDRLLRFGAVIKQVLGDSQHRVALLSRSGLDLSRFGMRYSHAGVGLLASANAPWSVRQLYFACDEGRPRLFDQGLSGFVLGTGDPSLGYVSVLLLPPAEAAALERLALDNASTLQLLGPAYSANAYAFGLRYQNCNQWLAELLAMAWGGLDDAGAPRARAQRWLQEQGYTPSVFEVGSRALMALAEWVPWLHSDDHPQEDLAQAVYRVSMPAAIEAFVRAQVPGAQRIEFCHDARQAVIRHGWDPIAEGCVAASGDTVVALD